MADAFFTAKALTKIYTSGEVQVHALQGVDLEIWGGEVVVLLGPSGSGKSTLLNIMGGLDHATSGRLFFRDLELTGLDDRGLTAYRRRHVGFVFQFYNLIPSLTARENVSLVTEISERPMPGGGARIGRARGPNGPFPGAAFWRRAAAGGHRSRHSQAAGSPSVR